MKNFRIVTMIALLSLTVSACSEEAKNETEQMRDQIESTTKALGNDIQVSKDKFITNAEDEIEALDKKVAELDQKMGNASDDVQAETQKALDNLNEHKERLERDLDSLKNSTKDNWKILAGNIESGFEDLKVGYNNLLNKKKAG
jgi:TolA-binding protein